MPNLPGALEFSPDDMAAFAKDPVSVEYTLIKLKHRGESQKSLDFFKYVLQRHREAQHVPTPAITLEGPFTVVKNGTGLHTGRLIDICDALGRPVMRMLKLEGETVEERYARAVKMCEEMNRE